MLHHERSADSNDSQGLAAHAACVQLGFQDKRVESMSGLLEEVLGTRFSLLKLLLFLQRRRQ